MLEDTVVGVRAPLGVVVFWSPEDEFPLDGLCVVVTETAQEESHARWTMTVARSSRATRGRETVSELVRLHVDGRWPRQICRLTRVLAPDIIRINLPAWTRMGEYVGVPCGTPKGVPSASRRVRTAGGGCGWSNAASGLTVFLTGRDDRLNELIQQSF